MQYALLIYNEDDSADPARGPVPPGIAAVLNRPEVTGWIRLRAAGSATTVRHSGDRMLLTDGPFIDSKEYLGGIVTVETEDLDGALAIADALQAARPDRAGAIEVRPAFGADDDA